MVSLSSLADPFRDEHSVEVGSVGVVAVVERAVVLLALLEQLHVVRDSRLDHVVRHYNRSLPYGPILLQQLEVLQVEVLGVVDKDDVEGPSFLDSFSHLFSSAQVHHDAVTQASQLIDLLCNVSRLFVDVEAVHLGTGEVRHHQGGIPDVAPELKDELGLLFLQHHLEDLSPLVPHVHHPVVGAGAEFIDGVED